MRRVIEGAKLGIKGASKIALPTLIILSIFSVTMLVSSVTWSVYETRLTSYLDFDGIPSIIETDDRRLWIFWTRKIGNEYDVFYATSEDAGRRWSQATQLTSSGGINSGVSACQAADSAIWLVWTSDRTGNYEIFYKTSSDYGNSWSNDTQLTFHSGRDLKPVARQLSDGSMWIVWSSDRSGGYDLYRKVSLNNGGSWSEDVRLTTDSSLDKMPSLAQMSNGSIWLAWASDRTGNYDLYYKISSDLGVSWSNDTQLTDGPKVESNPCLLQTMNEDTWIFWSKREPADVETATDDIYYMYSSDGGATWSDSVQFTVDKYDDIWPSVIQTRRAKIWVVWTSDRATQPDWGNYDIYFRTSLVGDVNEDGAVNVVDITIASIAYGSFEMDPDYNPQADLNDDGIVDMWDVSAVAINLGAM